MHPPSTPAAGSEKDPAKMSHSHPAGLLAAYNSLTDKHLAGYFNNTRIRRHLLRSGLITRSGRILSEKEYKLNIMKRDHQKYIRECLAQAIFHKVLDMERYHQLEIKKKLETLARKERIWRFKGEPTRWSIENNMPALSPHPPVGPKTNRGHSVLMDEGHFGPITLTASRPYTAPGNMQPPIRLQPLPSNPAVGTVPKMTSGSRSKTSLLENKASFPIGGKKAVMKFRNSMDNSEGMNRYQLLNINSYMPLPPPCPPNGKITWENRPGTWRRRRFRPITATNGLEPLLTRDSRRIHRTPVHSNAAVTMIYLGKNVHLSYVHSDFRDEIKVYQQHCGGENLCVYKGKLLEKETFQFISKRHHGFPFSLTFFLNGMQVNRLSSCCEYKHRKGSRVGGKRGYFGFVCVERSTPCYKCIIAMGLDKKSTSPKPRKQRSIEKREELDKGKVKPRKDRAYMIPRRNEMEGHKTSASGIFSAEEEKTGVEEVRTAVEEMEHKRKPGQYVWEDDQENIFKYEYEEDFEVDEEKQDEKANEGQAYDQMNGMLKSPKEDERDNINPKMPSETLTQKVPDADDNVKYEGDGCSESELEEDKQDIKNASSVSSGSHPYSSCSEDESALGDREAQAENSPRESDRSSSSQELSENDEPGQSHLPTEDSLNIVIEDQEIIQAGVEVKLLPIKESLENVFEEETEKGTQVIEQGLSKKFREHVFKEEKKNDKSKLWEGRTAKVKDKKAGPHWVEKGDLQSVGQIIAEAVEAGCHCPYDTGYGVSSADDGEKHSRKLEIDTRAAPNRNLVVEERETLSSNKESKPVTSEMCTLEKKEPVEKEEVPQHRDIATTEEKGDTILRGKAGIDEVPYEELKPTTQQLTFVEQFTEERGIPLDIASGAEAEAEVDSGLNKEGLNLMGKEVASASAGLKEDEAPTEQALMQTVLGTDRAASKEKRGSEKAMFASKAPAQNSESAQEATALRQAVMLKREAERRAAVSKAGTEGSEEEAFTDLEDAGPEQDSASQGKGGSEEVTLGREESAQESKVVMGTEIPLRSSTYEKTEATQMEVSKDSLEGVCKEDVERKLVVTELECNKENDREETLPEEFYATKQRMKAERPKTPLGETESEREEVTRVSAVQNEDISKEQRFNRAEGETMKEVRSGEEAQGPQMEIRCDVENEAPAKACELIEETGPQEGDALRKKEVTLFKAAPGFEKSLENITAVGERLRDAGDADHRGRARPLHGDDKNMAPSEQDEGPGPGGDGICGAPELDSGREATEAVITATGQAQECTARGQDGFAGLERRDKEGSLQERQGVRAMAMTQEVVPEGRFMMEGKLSEEVMDGNPEEETNKECTLGTGVMTSRDAEGAGSLPGGVVIAEECVHKGGTAEMAEENREMLADSKTADRITEANEASNFSDVAGEETWHKMDELLGKIAIEVAVGEIALSREEVPAVEEVTVIGASETGVGALREHSDLEGKAPQLQKAGAAGTTLQRAESGGEEAGVGSCAGGPKLGQVEEFRPGVFQEREPELSRDHLQDKETLPVKPSCTGVQETQEHTVQRESENTVVSMHDDMKA